VPLGVTSGNAHEDAPAHHGWLLGHFVDDADPRHTRDVEVKWDVHAAGDERAGWVERDDRTALCVLFSGRLRLSFPDGDVVLSRQGDYVLWREVAHTWRVEADSVALVVRWPSLEGYEPGGLTP
jgi:hypothetical protein